MNDIIRQKTPQPDIGVEIKFGNLETFLLTDSATIFRYHLDFYYSFLLNTLDHEQVDDALAIKFQNKS